LNLKVKILQRGTINLWLVSIIMMLVTIAGLTFLYTVRYGHLPFQETWARWSKSGNVIANELKNASGIQTRPSEAGQAQLGGNVSGQNSNLPAPVTVDSGIKKCMIKGKVVYSDTECTDSNPTSRAVKLQDNKGFEPPKVAKPVAEKEDSAQTAEADLRLKLIEKAINKSTGKP
jgi:hypothetical protein